jgi:tRNA(Ile)-lysidine synthase TilS/MesJ
MCGILGVFSPNNEEFNRKYFKKVTDELFKFSENRGRESAGICLLSDNIIKVYKQPTPASELLKSQTYNELFRFQDFRHVFAIGHARLVTNGDLDTNINNQPVSKDNIIGVHNGIITNVEELWSKNKNLNRKYEVDTELFLSLIRKHLKAEKGLSYAIGQTFKAIEGAASVGLMFTDLKTNVLATNTGSLYYALSDKKDILVYASEYDILHSLFKALNFNKFFTKAKIEQLPPGRALIISQKNLKIQKVGIFESAKVTLEQADYDLEDLSRYPKSASIRAIIKPLSAKVKQDFKKSAQKIAELRRCSQCILPETIPFIEFDEKGVCNYCRNYEKMKVKGPKKLEEYLRKYRKNNGRPDVLMTFSGGRDSSYGLHYMKTLMKMNPVAYSYDWGMLTDLGRRNQVRMTADLGVEHILISANIKNKRDNIRRNVLAWLKKPDLGTVPLFMAGDKQYFYYANKLGQVMGIDLIVLCINPLERTDFKFGLCGIKPKVNVTYRLTSADKMKLALYYGKKYLTNPSYINRSLLDTLFAYFAYYLIAHEYLSLYEYIRWDEETINNTLLRKYKWEMADDTKTTWRIGDGTAPFYNYIYYLLAGFTENDTFRSNQIREGTMTRAKALELSMADNLPRYDSMQWYTNTIGIDLEESLRIINNAPKLYR